MNSQSEEIKEEVKEEKKQATSQQVMVAIQDTGRFNFTNQVELATAARLVMQIKLAPEHLRKEGVEAVMSAMTLCKQHSLPLSAMNEMAYIKGKITCYGSLITALAQRSPDYGDMKVIYVSEDQKEISLANKNLNELVWACVIRIKKKNQDEWNEFYFTWNEVVTAGLDKNYKGDKETYKHFRKDMLYHKAKKRALETSYPAATNGLVYHEVENYISDIRDVGSNARPRSRLAEKLNEDSMEKSIDNNQEPNDT